MAFVVIGVLLVLAKLLDVWPVLMWSWWTVLAPFGLAILWWAWSDSIGSPQRAAVRQMEAKRVARRLKAMEALGIKRKR
ncbi:MAG: TIGR04438 family Trp-rich protein [Leptothrix sp. (in: b-proteobacteria)]|jgi:small Trp-rich protein